MLMGGKIAEAPSYKNVWDGQIMLYITFAVSHLRKAVRGFEENVCKKFSGTVCGCVRRCVMVGQRWVTEERASADEGGSTFRLLLYLRLLPSHSCLHTPTLVTTM